MTNRIIPTRVVETGRVARGASGQGVGWLQSLAERARNLRAKIVGINDRINTPFVNGVPACIDGELLFRADTTKQITIPNFPTNPDKVPPAAFIANLVVNPIILSGQTYRIPITFTPPGVLHAHNLVVGIEAGFINFANSSRNGITPLNDYRQSMSDQASGGFVPSDPSIGSIQYTWQQQVLGDFTDVMPFLPYLWNIVDEKSGRPYAQDWIPGGALLNTRGNGTGERDLDVEGAQHSLNLDSELFEFDTPWQFERDAQVSFLFRPIMDLYQIDASSGVLPYGSVAGIGGVDDRNGGLRNLQATVKVEFHGNRYYTAQDLLKDGAFVTNSEPHRHPYGVDDADNSGYDDGFTEWRGGRPPSERG